MSEANSDKILARSAVEKIRAGQRPTGAEAAALRRLEREQEESRRWQYYRSVPAKHYKQMSGRDARVLIDLQARHGIPCAGATVDLTAVVRWAHDFLAQRPKLREEAVPGEPVSPETAATIALGRYRLAEAERAELELARMKDDLLRRDEVEQIVVALVHRLVRACQLLEVTIGTEMSIWLADPKIRAMDADSRNRTASDFVRRTCDEVRRALAEDYESLICRQRAENEAEGA